MGPGDRQSTDHIHDPRVPAVITYMRPVEEFVQDARYALRGMRRTPGFTAVAALTLALGIGANTAIFSVLYGVWLSPAKYAHSERLVDLTMQQLSGRRLMGGTSYSNLADWKAQASTVEAFGIHRYTFEVNVTGGVGAEEVFGHRVSANLFGLLGARPAVGRPMEAGADRSTGPRQALIAYTWWMRRFGGDAGIVGRQIQVDDEAFTIAGVMPPGFEFPAMGSAAFRPVIWMSLNLPVEQERARDSHSLRVVARLKPGASIRQAQAEMDTIAARLANAYPHENGGWGVKVTRLTDVRQLEDVRPALLLVMAAASLLLLIACANIANLLVARAAGREREMAIRRALGVTWRRLARQLLTESGMLALGGGAAGVLLAYGTLPLLKSVLPANMPRAEEISLNGAVLGFAAGVSLLTGLLFGLIPAVRPGGGSRNRATRLLVAAEVALALVLLAGAGLLMESFQRVSNVDLGFRKEHMLTARMELSKRSYPDGQRVRAFREELLRRVHALPGVQYAGTVSSLPMGTISQGTEFVVEGRPETEREKPFASFANTSTDYLRAMGIPLVGGRYFAASDGPAAPPVTIISESLARAWWPGTAALGRRIQFDGTWTKEIGIRMALGATPASVLVMVARETLLLAVVGAAIGLGGTLATSRLLARFLYGVGPTEPAIVAGVAMVLVAIVVGSGLFPARRAMRVDPVVALREE